MVEFHLPAVLATKIMQPLPGVATCWWPKDLDANLPHMVTCMAWSAQKYSLTVKALPDSSKISSMAALQAAKKNATSRKINGWLQWPVTLHCFVTEQEIVDGAGLENMLRQQPRAFRLTSGAPCLLTFWHAIAVALKEGKAGECFCYARQPYLQQCKCERSRTTRLLPN